MSDEFQTLVFSDLSEQDALTIATRIVDHLVAKGIVAATRSDCTLGSELGYPPGPQAAQACEAARGQEFLSLQTNGVDVEVGRAAFPALEGGLEPVTCPQCNAERSADDDWYAAVDDWETGGEGSTKCQSCGHQCSIARWNASPYWGFGTLGLTFWNWPRLKPSFVDHLAQLAGSRIVIVNGAL